MESPETSFYGDFPLDKQGSVFYPECRVCEKHPQYPNTGIDACEFYYCDFVVEKYPNDFL